MKNRFPGPGNILFELIKYSGTNLANYMTKLIN